MKLFTGWVLSAAGIDRRSRECAGPRAVPKRPSGLRFRLRWALRRRCRRTRRCRRATAMGRRCCRRRRSIRSCATADFRRLAPQLRGYVYAIAVVDRRGDDGRLVIDARNGRILRFVPAYRMGDNFRGDMTYGPVGAPPPAGPVAAGRGHRPRFRISRAARHQRCRCRRRPRHTPVK